MWKHRRRALYQVIGWRYPFIGIIFSLVSANPICLLRAILAGDSALSVKFPEA